MLQDGALVCGTHILPWAGWVASGDAELCFVASWRKGTGSRCWVVLLLIYNALGCAGAWPPALLSSSSSCDFVFQVIASCKTLKYSWDVLSAPQVEDPQLERGPQPPPGPASFSSRSQVPLQHWQLPKVGYLSLSRQVTCALFPSVLVLLYPNW